MNSINLRVVGTAVFMGLIGIGGAAQAGEDKGLHTWIKGANEAVDQVMRYPYAAKKNGFSGRSTYAVTINREGEVINSELIDSTGRKVFQSAGKKVVRKAEFPALPTSYKGEELRFAVKLNYQMISTSDQMLALRKETRVRSRRISEGTPVAGRITILSQASE